MIVIVHHEARSELNSVADYYNQEKTGLEQDFLNAFDFGLSEVTSAPERWPIYLSKTRRYLLDKFPYSIVYQFKNDTLTVFAVTHFSRRPSYWRHRLKH